MNQKLQPMKPAIRSEIDRLIYFGRRCAFLSKLTWFAKSSTVVLLVSGSLSAQAQAPHQEKIARWFSLDTAHLSTRYHFIENADGTTATNNNQYQVSVRGAFKLDRSAKYSLHAGLFTGNTFPGGWNATGWGTGQGQGRFFLKQLYLSAKPLTGLEVQYGGFGFVRGQSTEATTYDNDGYLTGERIILTRPNNFYFDEISITYGYLGDFTTPNVIHRFDRLAQSNYHQFVLSKKLNERIRFSSEYAYDAGVDVFRQAINVGLHELHVIDRVLFEDYERISPDNGYGLGLYGEKKVYSHLTLSGGYTQIDRPGLNSDRFLQGKRLYANALFPLTSEFDITTGITRGIGVIPPKISRTRFDLVFEYNLLHTLKRTGIF